MDKMNSTHTNTDRFPEQTLLAELRRAKRAREVEDHERQLASHTRVVRDLAVQVNPDMEAIEAHAKAGKLHTIARFTGHQADATRAWEATMFAAEIDGSV